MQLHWSYIAAILYSMPFLIHFYVVLQEHTCPGPSVFSVEPESVPESISSCQSQELFSHSSTASSPTNSDIDSELSSVEDSFESKSTSSSCKKLVLAKKALCNIHQVDSDTSENVVSGFRLINLAQLASLVGQLLCPHCHCDELVLKKNPTQRKGLCSWLDLIFSFVSSGLVCISLCNMGHVWR